MKLMARSPQPFSSSTPPRAVDTARQGMNAILFYPYDKSFPNIFATNALTKTVINQVPTEIIQLANRIKSSNPDYDVLHAALSVIRSFQSGLTSSISQTQQTRWGPTFLQWSNPEHLALDLVTQTTDPTRQVQLLVAPRSKKLSEKVFESTIPELEFSVLLTNLTQSPRTKQLEIEGQVQNGHPISEGYLEGIFKALSLPDVAVHLNRP